LEEDIRIVIPLLFFNRIKNSVMRIRRLLLPGESFC